MTYHPRRSNHDQMTATRRALGLAPAELSCLVAVISHERVTGESPSRHAVAEFLGSQPKGYGLIRMGWITSRIVQITPFRCVAIWSSTKVARVALGVEEEERRSA